MFIAAGYTLPAILLAASAILYAIASIYFRPRPADPTVPQWIRAAGVDETGACDAAARVELVERLAMIGEPWCAQALHDARKEERDRTVREAIARARKQLRS